LAAHGVARSTQDLDVLVLDSTCLAPAPWQPLMAAGVRVDIREGDDADPLRGVVRFIGRTALGMTAVIDVIVGRSGWQLDLIRRATPRSIEGVVVPVATSGDVVVLKLFAGGPQDAWDIEQLLAAGDRSALVGHVEGLLPQLPEDARRLWARIVRPR
jgi:hypothetical protein